MINQFAPYDLSQRLKTLGFSEGCFARYRRGKFQSNTLCRLIDYNTQPIVQGDISAPLIQQAFDFLDTLIDVDYYWKKLDSNPNLKGFWRITSEYDMISIRNAEVDKNTAKLKCLEVLIGITEDKINGK